MPIPICVVSAPADPALQQTVGHVDAAPVHDLAEVIATLRTRPPVPAGATLDLLGHARAGVLELGRWSTGAPAAAAALVGGAATELRRVGVVQLRLLGCGTAATPAGRAVLHAFAGALRDAGLAIAVLGTTVPLWAGDFDARGLRREFRGLIDAANL